MSQIHEPPEVGAASANDDADPRIGQRLGRWDVVAPLGRGGVAMVYRVRDESGAEAALKIMHVEATTQQTLVESFYTEIRLLAQFDHPGLLDVYDQGVDETGIPWFVMELVDGATLDDLVKPGEERLELEQILFIANQLLPTLHAVHRAGIVHRDIKPSNVLLDSDGHVRLLDFGIALEGRPDQEVHSGSRLGTPGYMPPEQAVNATLGVDARSDLFAFGAMMHVLASGQPIRDVQTADEAFIMAATTPAPSLARHAADLPIPFIRWVDKAKEWAPEDRWADAMQMHAALESMTEELGTSTNSLAQQAQQDLLRRALARGGFGAAEDKAKIDDPEEALRRVKEMCKQMGRAVAFVRRAGWESPETVDAFESFKGTIRDVLEIVPVCVTLTVKPHRLVFEGEPCWEPDVGLAEIPYFLFQSGFRAIRIMNGFRDSEIKGLLNLLRLNPFNDLDEEDDLSTVFLESDFEKIEANILGGFDIDLLDEYDDVAGQMNEIAEAISDELSSPRSLNDGLADLADSMGSAGLAEADSLRLDLRGRVASNRLPIGLREKDVETIEAIESDFEPMRIERRMQVFARACSDAMLTDELDLVIDPIDERLQALKLAEGLDELVLFLATLSDHLEPEITAMILAAVIDRGMVRVLIRGVEANESEDFRAAAGRVISSFDDATLNLSLRELADPAISPETMKLFMKELSRRPRAGALAATEIAKTLPAGIAAVMVHIYSEVEFVVAPLQSLTKHPTEKVQLRAAIALAQNDHEDGAKELAWLLNSRATDIRLGALRALTSIRPPGTANVLAERIGSSVFDDTPHEEQYRLLRTLFETDAPRAERIAIELIEVPKLMSGRDVESRRRMAAEMLGAMGRTPDALAALETEAGRRMRNSKALRQSCAKAIAGLKRRLGV